MKLVPLFEYIDRTFQRLAVSRLSARINESVSNENVTSICTALLAIQVNIAPYLLTTNREICHLLFSKSFFQSTRVITSEYEVLHYRICTNYPVNIGRYEDVLKTSWRRLSSSSSEGVFKASSQRLDQDEYVRFSLMSWEDVFKASWSRPIYSSWLYVFKTSSRRFQDVFKTSCQYVFKTFSRRL